MAKPARYTEEELNKLVENGTWETTISDVWDRNAEQYPEKKAIEDQAKALSWEQARNWIDRIALGLVKLGVNRDQATVVQLPNCVELHLLRVACEKAGILCVPILSNMRESEMEYILNYTDAVALVIPWEFRGFNYVDMIKKIRPKLPKLKHVLIVGNKVGNIGISINDIAQRPLEKKYGTDYLKNRRYRLEEVSLVFLTSGTTGFPKFVEYPSGACSSVGRYLVDILNLTSSDVIAAIAPAGRGPNLSVYFAAPQIVANIVMIPWLGAKKALKTIEQKRVTVACLVPTQLAMMLEEADKQYYDLSSVRIWLSAGSLLPASLASAVEKRMGGVVLSTYGAVDFGAITIPLPADPFDVRMSTVGKPRLGVKLKIVDDSGEEIEKGRVGEITAQGPCSASGYYKDSGATEEAWNKEGWYATGDLGRFDEAGNLVIVGRKKDMIIRGGQNVYPNEIENLLITHPKIKNVAIVGMPDSLMGERVCAYVVLTPGHTLTLDEVLSFLKAKGIAPFKLPERLEIIDKLPLAGGQKVDKKILKRAVTRKLETEQEVN